MKFAYCHSKSEKFIDHRDSEIEAIVIVTMTFGIVMVDMLFHDALAVMAPFVIAIPMTVPAVMAIAMPTVILIPVTIPPAMLVAVPVWIPFALLPSVMMSWRVLALVMVAFVVSVPSLASVMISPSVAAQGQQKSDQNDSDEYALPCHVNLLCIGLKTRSLWSV